MKLFKTNNLVSVINVSDYEASLAWYQTWLGEPDEMPMEGMAEWRIADNAWLQLTSGSATGQTEVVIGVDDVAACREALIRAGIDEGKIVDWEVLLACDISDSYGNKIPLVQLTA